MARVRGPLMSFEASGTFAGAMQFRGNRAGQHVYRPPDPAKVNQVPPSLAQAAIRARYADAAATWAGLSDPERQTWEARADLEPGQVHGWNLYLRAYLKAPVIPEPDGGTPALGPVADLDGGSPATEPTLNLDGGAP